MQSKNYFFTVSINVAICVKKSGLLGCFLQYFKRELMWLIFVKMLNFLCGVEGGWLLKVITLISGVIFFVAITEFSLDK